MDDILSGNIIGRRFDSGRFNIYISFFRLRSIVAFFCRKLIEDVPGDIIFISRLIRRLRLDIFFFGTRMTVSSLFWGVGELILHLEEL